MRYEQKNFFWGGVLGPPVGMGSRGQGWGKMGPGDQGTREWGITRGAGDQESPLACPRVGEASAKRLGGGHP